MSTDRKVREADARALEIRLENWEPPEALPNPEPVDGWVFRWVRVGMMGDTDMRNFSVRRREGWQPCVKSDHPELMHLVDQDRQQGNELVVGGLMLCRMPELVARKRQQFYEQMAGAQLKAVDNAYFREQDKRMPLFSDRDTQVGLEFGKGQK